MTRCTGVRPALAITVSDGDAGVAEVTVRSYRPSGHSLEEIAEAIGDFARDRARMPLVQAST